jgi:hypothetical protein
VAGGVVGVAVVAIVISGLILLNRYRTSEAQAARNDPRRTSEAAPAGTPVRKPTLAAAAPRPAAKKTGDAEENEAIPVRIGPPAKPEKADRAAGPEPIDFDPTHASWQKPLGQVAQPQELRVKLPVPAADVLALLLSGAETNLALVYRRNEANADRPDRKERLDRYDLADGTLKDSLEIDPSFKLAGANPRMDFSPDGKYFALADAGGSVTLWSLDPPKRVAIDWKLLPPETPADQRRTVGLAALYLLTEGRLVSVHTTGAVTLWTVEDQKPVKTFTPPASVNAKPLPAGGVRPEQRRSVAVSPDRQFLVYALGDRLFRYEPASMTAFEMQSLVGGDGTFHQPLGLTVTFDGQVVILSQDQPAASAKLTKAAAGKPATLLLRYGKSGPPVTLAAGGAHPPAKVVARGGSTLLLSDETDRECVVIDSETGKPLANWHLWNGVGVQSLEELKGRHWYVTAEKPTDPGYLVGTPAGGEGLRDMKEQAKVIGPRGGTSFALTASGLQGQ